jgi:hypothetical protein
MPFTILCALGVILDPWTLKPDLTANKTTSWSLAIEVSMNGSTQRATAILNEIVKGPADATGQVPAHFEMTDITSESGEALPDSVADGTLDAQNMIQSTKDDDEDRRMFAPLLFAYPVKPVNVGDTWNIESKVAAAGAPKIDYSYTAKSIEQENGTDVLLITNTAKEASSDGFDETGQWWVGKDGKVVKFKVDIKRWHVSVQGGMTLDAVISGNSKHSAGGLR